MFVAWRELRFAKWRFTLTGAVVALITLLVGLLSGLTAGLARQNVSAIAALPVDRIAFAAPDEGREVSYAESAVTARQWRRWAEAPGVRSAEPLGIATTRATRDRRGAVVAAFGVRPGSPLAPDGGPGDARGAVLSATAAADLGVRAGDTFDLAGQRLTVSAVRGDAHYSHLPVVWTGLDVWRRIAPPLGPGGRPAATVIALDTAVGTDLRAVDRAAGTKTLGKEDSFAAIGSYASENTSLRLMRGFLVVIAALVAGAFFHVWTVQRAADVAVLKALGASTAALLADALGQALVLLLLGTLAGTAAAVALGALLAGSAVPFLLTATGAVVPAAAVTVLGTLGAALSLRRITSVDPLTALGSAR